MHLQNVDINQVRGGQVSGVVGGVLSIHAAAKKKPRGLVRCVRWFDAVTDYLGRHSHSALCFHITTRTTDIHVAVPNLQYLLLEIFDLLVAQLP